jgi:hypothetical protein
MNQNPSLMVDGSAYQTPSRGFSDVPKLKSLRCSSFVLECRKWGGFTGFSFFLQGFLVQPSGSKRTGIELAKLTNLIQAIWTGLRRRFPLVIIKHIFVLMQNQRT